MRATEFIVEEVKLPDNSAALNYALEKINAELEGQPYQTDEK